MSTTTKSLEDLDPEVRNAIQEKLPELMRRLRDRDGELARLRQENAELREHRHFLADTDIGRVRDRISTLTMRIVGELTPADLRDVALAIAALTSAVDDMTHLSGAILVRDDRARDWVKSIDALLDTTHPDGPNRLVDDAGSAAASLERIWWRVKEGVVDDLAMLLDPRS